MGQNLSPIFALPESPNVHLVSRNSAAYPSSVASERSQISALLKCFVTERKSCVNLVRLLASWSSSMSRWLRWSLIEKRLRLLIAFCCSTESSEDKRMIEDIASDIEGTYCLKRTRMAWMRLKKLRESNEDTILQTLDMVHIVKLWTEAS